MSTDKIEPHVYYIKPAVTFNRSVTTSYRCQIFATGLSPAFQKTKSRSG